jgi:subtilisin family serine protease
MGSISTTGKSHRQKRIAGIHHDVPGSLFGAPGDDAIPGEVILQLDPGASGALTGSIAGGPSRGRMLAGTTAFGHSDLDRALAGLGVTSIARLHPPAPMTSMAMTEATALASTFRVRFDPANPVEQAITTLSAVDGVEFAEPNRYRETYIVPNDTSYASQWGLAKINCPDAWDHTTGAPGVVVAVIDTGVDLDHPELAPLLVAGTDMVDLGPNPTPPPGFRFEGDFTGVDNVPQDEVGHGTHVTGTIACLSNNGAGVAGVTWNCRVMPVRALARIVNVADPTDVRGVGSAADIAAGIRWAVDHGARVLNLSLGGPSDTQVERDAIAYAVAQGAVVCAAMGNGGPGAGPSFPGAYPDVVAVGAIDQADHRASFSQVGPHIDIVGPGVGILSTVWDNGYATYSGTSMATPHVAGVAALVFSANPSLTAVQAADILRQSARPLRDQPGDPVPNDSYGFGCVDARAAVERAMPATPVPPPSAQIACRPTVLCAPSVRCLETATVRCTQSTLIACPTQQLICAPSVVVICQTSALRCTASIACRLTTTFCPPSGRVCPSALACPSAAACPSGPVCGGPQPGPGDPGMNQLGWSQAPGWGDLAAGEGDPYAAYYGRNEGGA